MPDQPQLVFVHGPGAGGCAEAFAHQMRRFPGALAPTLPGHPDGEPCVDIARYTEWLRGWLWAHHRPVNLVIVGYTLGACIGLQYALDYPDEVAGLVLMTVSIGPKQRPPGAYDFRLKALDTPENYAAWLAYQEHALMFTDPALRARLLECHKRIGPISQYRDLFAIDQFDVRDRIEALKTPLILIRGMEDPTSPPEYEAEIHAAVPGSKYVRLERAGHFPMAERPDDVNRIIEDLIASLDRGAALRAFVHGRVQGVGFRYFVQDHAAKLDLHGFARNLSNGTTVEVVAEGPRPALETLLARLRNGPSSAQVEKVDATWADASGGYEGFKAG